MKPKEVRRHLNETVYYTNSRLFIENSPYILTAAVFRKDKRTGEVYYQAELTPPHSARTGHTPGSVIYCGLEEITEQKGTENDVHE